MIYIDSDGVLADFYGWCRRYEPQVSKSDSDTIRRLMVEKSKECFASCDRIAKSNFLFYILRTRQDAVVLTAITPVDKLLPYCSREEAEKIVEVHKENKYRWFEKHGVSRDRVIIVNDSKEKKCFCHGSEDILIDDYERNIREWNDAGGKGILWEAG